MNFGSYFSVCLKLFCRNYQLHTCSHNSITSTGLNLINCNHNHYSPSSTLLLCVHSRYNLFAHSHALHTLSHCTSYPLFYFIICFLFHSHHICIYIYSLVFLFHSFYCFYVIFILLSCFIFLSCTFHWADLSWLTFHYLLYPVWLCMWQIIKNLETLRTLNVHWLTTRMWNTSYLTFFKNDVIIIIIIIIICYIYIALF